jgi:hypothetical protein
MGAAIEAAMLDAHRAGLSVIPLGPGKRPSVSSWAEWVDAQPDELAVRAWARNADGFAMICGGPQRVQVLDFEARFIAECWHPFVMALEDDELLATFLTWLEGYDVITPSGGKHVAVHVIGEGDQDGNRKLAMAADRSVIAETRGHGGYVAAAPSNGTTHQSGGQWVQNQGSFEQIAWATAEEWNAICSVIATFDAGHASVVAESPPEPSSTSAPGGLSLDRIERSGSWIDGVQMPPISEILERAGWQFLGSRADRDYWRRPGKDEGNSATVHNGRLFVHSTNAAPIPDSPSNGNATFDVVDVIGYLTDRWYHHDNRAARVTVLRGFRQLTAQPVHIPVDIAVEPIGWISDDFWEARPWLSAIRDTAHGNQACPEALLGAVLSTYATSLPSSIRIAPIVSGGDSPLNTYTALCGRSGSGKTSTMAMARALCGATDSQDFRYAVNLRSGEGLVTSVLVPQPRRKDEAELTPLYRRGVQVEFDEGKALQQQNDRSGSTMLPYMLTAWSGSAGSKVGGTKAAGEEAFPADLVRVCAVLGIQFGVGGGLFTGEAAALGFPGRLLFFGMDHLGPKLMAGTQRRAADIGLPYYPPEVGREIGQVYFPREVQQAVIDWDYAVKSQGGDRLDGHMMLLRLRTSLILGLMDSNAQPEVVHWDLAGEIERHSRFTRTRVVDGINSVRQEQARAAGFQDHVRDTARQDAWIEDRAERLASYVHGRGGSPVPWRAIKDRFNASDRKQLPFIVAYAEERSWVQLAVGGGPRAYLPGERKPPRR